MVSINHTLTTLYNTKAAINLLEENLSSGSEADID